MSELLIMVGPPGSGKSTISKAMGSKYVRINQDELGKEEHKNIFGIILSNEGNIIIDRMNFSKEQRARYLEPAKKAGYKTKIIVLHENFDTCLERMKVRENHPTIKDEKIGRKVLHFFFSKYERPTPDEADEIEFRYPEGEKENAIWVDMDNTLSDATHREHFLGTGRKNWKAFFDAMDKDPINDWCRMITNSIYDYADVLICSARPEDYREVTEKWLKDNTVWYNKLIMRQKGDFRKDSIVKEIFLDFEIKTKYNLLFSIDDRKQVIDQMRSRGVTVLDCAGEKGNF